jgi:hypothetical protein
MKHKVQEFEKLVNQGPGGGELEMAELGPPSSGTRDESPFLVDDPNSSVERDRYIGEGSHYESS